MNRTFGWPSKVYTTTQIAKICNVDRNTVVRWIDSGLLTGWRMPRSNHRRVKKETLDAFIEKHLTGNV